MSAEVLALYVAMREWDIDKLAKEVAHVCTVGFGRELRGKGKADQLVSIAELLGADSTLRPFRLYEKALRPSIDRLGQGRLGRIAQIEFGVSPEALNLHSRKERRAKAADDQGLDPKQDRFETLEAEMFRALAEDLLARLGDGGPSSADEPGSLRTEDRFSEVSMEKRKAEGYF